MPGELSLKLGGVTDFRHKISVVIRDNVELKVIPVPTIIDDSEGPRYSVLPRFKLMPRYSCSFKSEKPCVNVKQNIVTNRTAFNTEESVSFSEEDQTLTLEKNIGILGSDDGLGEYSCVYRKVQ